MFEQRPTFMARKNPGTGWGIDILWPDGETEVVKGFITERDAVKWIAEHSKAWQGTRTNSPAVDHNRQADALEIMAGAKRRLADGRRA
jgi:hypothetical protein